ncbi:MAG: hypothetical protein ABFD64_09245 [Armatimonadota bacterium]
MTVRVVFVLTLIVLTAPVFGAASGLNLMPTADVLEKGTAAVETERAGEQFHMFTSKESALLMQLGLGKDIEIGYDDYSDGKTFGAWNVKLAVAWRNGFPAAAIGVQNVGNGIKPQPYAVGHIPFVCGRLHAGLIGINGSTHPMFGYDRSLNERLMFQADYIEGDENAGSLGLSFNLSSSIGITAAYIRNNVGPDRDNCLLTLSWYPSIF